MGDQLVTKAYFQGFASTITTALTALTNLVSKTHNNAKQPRCGNNRDKTDFTNHMTILINQINDRQRDRGGEPTIRVYEKNRAIIIENSSADEEELMEKEMDQRNLYNDHDYRMKADIPLLYVTLEVEETIIPKGALVIERNFKELIADEHKKHYKEGNPWRKKSSILVKIHSKKKLDYFF